MTELTKKSERQWLRVIPGIAISLIAIVLLLMTVDLSQAWDELVHANYLWLILAVVFFLGTLTVRSMAGRRILEDKITWSRSFWTLNESYLMNNVLPFRLGEIGRALILNLTEKIPFWQVLSAIMVERIIDVSFMVVLLLATAPFAAGLDDATQIANLAGVVVVIGLAVLFWCARYTDTLMRWFEGIFGRFKRFANFARDKVRSLLDGIIVLADFRNFAVVVGWLLLAWTFNVLFYWAVLKMFLPESTVLLAAFLVGATSLGVSIPSSPGYVGVYHGVVVSALGLFGIAAEKGLAIALVAHLAYEIITITLGAYGLSQDGLSLLSLFSRVQNREEEVSENER